MEYVILGLLLLRARTMYEIKHVFEDTLALFYSASFGSISTAIGKLLEKGWIAVQEQVDNGRNKKIYTITPAGTAVFQEWLSSHIPSEKVKEPALTRMFFMGFLDPAQRIAVLEAHVATLAGLYATLDLLEAQTASLEIPAAQADLATFQKLTLQYGKDYYAFSLAWYRRLLSTLKEPSQ